MKNTALQLLHLTKLLLVIGKVSYNVSFDSIPKDACLQLPLWSCCIACLCRKERQAEGLGIAKRKLGCLNLDMFCFTVGLSVLF